MTHRWLRRALEDWTLAMTFAATQSPDHARNVVLAVERALQLIADNPEIGTAMPRNPNVRGWYVKTGQLWIFYVPTRETIEIWRVRAARTRRSRSTIDY